MPPVIQSFISILMSIIDNFLELYFQNLIFLVLFMMYLTHLLFIHQFTILLPFQSQTFFQMNFQILHFYLEIFYQFIPIFNFYLFMNYLFIIIIPDILRMNFKIQVKITCSLIISISISIQVLILI